jgi:hypothetical protein
VDKGAIGVREINRERERERDRGTSRPCKYSCERLGDLHTQLCPLRVPLVGLGLLSRRRDSPRSPSILHSSTHSLFHGCSSRLAVAAAAAAAPAVFVAHARADEFIASANGPEI